MSLPSSLTSPQPPDLRRDVFADALKLKYSSAQRHLSTHSASHPKYVPLPVPPPRGYAVESIRITRLEAFDALLHFVYSQWLRDDGTEIHASSWEEISNVCGPTRQLVRYLPPAALKRDAVEQHERATFYLIDAIEGAIACRRLLKADTPFTFLVPRETIANLFPFTFLRLLIPANPSTLEEQSDFLSRRSRIYWFEPTRAPRDNIYRLVMLGRSIVREYGERFGYQGVLGAVPRMVKMSTQKRKSEDDFQVMDEDKIIIQERNQGLDLNMSDLAYDIDRRAGV